MLTLIFFLVSPKNNFKKLYSLLLRSIASQQNFAFVHIQRVVFKVQNTERENKTTVNVSIFLSVLFSTDKQFLFAPMKSYKLLFCFYLGVFCECNFLFGFMIYYSRRFDSFFELFQCNDRATPISKYHHSNITCIDDKQKQRIIMTFVINDPMKMT